MTLEQLRARMAEIATELRDINDAAGDAALEGEQAERWASLDAEYDKVTADVEAAEARHARIAELGRANPTPGNDNERTAPNVNAGVSKSDPYDLSEIRSFGRSSREVDAELRSRALSAVESHQDLTDDQKEAVTQRFSTVRDAKGFMPQYVLRTGSEDYRNAFGKYMSGRSDMLTEAERTAVARAEEVRAALSTTDANGGYAIPFTLDPTLILTNAGVVNPVRQVARQVTITTDTWNGLSSAGVTASWDGEIAEVSDDSPTFANPSVTPKKAQAFVQGSIEITQDYAGLVGDLQMMFADAKDRLEGAAFISGTGSNQPQGIETALTGGGSVVTPGTVETFAVGDIYKVQQALPARYRGSNPVWMAEISTINAMRQFATANNYHAFLTDLGGGQPAQLLGHRLYENSSVDAHSAINPAATAANHILFYGDFSKYLIVDRVGMVVEYIPHLFNTATNLPDGRRGWYAHWRVGADSLVDDAFRVLNVATTA